MRGFLLLLVLGIGFVVVSGRQAEILDWVSWGQDRYAEFNYTELVEKKKEILGQLENRKNTLTQKYNEGKDAVEETRTAIYELQAALSEVQKALNTLDQAKDTIENVVSGENNPE